MRSDLLLLVPFQPGTGTFQDGPVRRTSIAQINLPMMEARAALEARLGRSLASEAHYDGPSRVGGAAHRSAGAVVLASALERAGLRWEAIDPGARELSYWRARLEERRSNPPHAVAISTTFVISAPWLRAMCAIVRRSLPTAKLIVGGYYYATSARDFLSLDADVLCVGEGEERLPRIVRALRDGAGLTEIPGLYLRRPEGGWLHTGTAEPLDLERLPMPDWRLAERIEPRVRIARDPLVYMAETQRGCVFKCEYCTYRTLAELELASAERAVEQLLSIVPEDAAPGSAIDIVDATATYPRERWERMLRLLIARGGSRFPISAYARVSDIGESTAELMKQAGVRRVFIGQESGDQGLLNRMKKGTRVEQVRPAVHALGRHGIDPILSFIHGFPSETRASLAATRSMITTLNDGVTGAPACTLYRVEPFSVYDFASVSRSAGLEDAGHYLAYEGTGALTIREVLTEVLVTFVEVSRHESAPVSESMLDWIGLSSGPFKRRMLGEERTNVHRWLKALERGIALELEHRVLGNRIDSAELSRVYRAIEAGLPRPSWRERLFTRAAAPLKAQGVRWLARECASESDLGPGPLTRLLLAGTALRDSGDPTATRTAFSGVSDSAPASALSQQLVDVAHTPRRSAADALFDARRLGRVPPRATAEQPPERPRPGGPERTK